MSVLKNYNLLLTTYLVIDLEELFCRLNTNEQFSNIKYYYNGYEYTKI